MCVCMHNGGKKNRSGDELPGYTRSEKTMCNKERKRVVSIKIYFFFVEVVFFFVEVVFFLVEVVFFFVVVLFVTVGAGL